MVGAGLKMSDFSQKSDIFGAFPELAGEIIGIFLSHLSQSMNWLARSTRWVCIS
jgi:hypothetical protein